MGERVEVMRKGRTGHRNAALYIVHAEPLRTRPHQQPEDLQPASLAESVELVNERSRHGYSSIIEI